MTDRDARTVPPAAPPAKPPPLPKARPLVDEKTRTDAWLGPSPNSAPGAYRKNSPPTFSRPPPPSQPTTALERELVRLRADVAQMQEADAREEERQSVVIPKQPAWVEQPWWKTSGGVVRVLGALFAGLAALGVGNWFANRPEPVPAVAPVELKCPEFADRNSARSSQCMRIDQIEQAIGTLQAQQADRRASDERQKKMLGEMPTVKP